jgi:diacylglycerol kinase (ATP)
VTGGAELLVAVGGDGTLNEVVNGLVEGDGAELALIPRGTGADFARTFAIPSRLEDAVRVALAGRTRAIDLGRATYRSWQGREEQAYFANIASVGMSGAVARRVNEAGRGWAKLSYLSATLAVFARWRSCRLRVRVDDEARAGVMQDVIVANGRYFAGGMRICPQAEPDDGLLDCLLIGDVSKGELLRALPKLYRGSHLPHPKGELLRGRLVSIEAEEPLPVQLDGEQPGTTPVRFEVVPGALRLRLPA